ncbi:MAG: hypothetical protein QOH32_1651 [Bradyrhizobium sp.]|jgi:hypothetical protein|nr:hypothetical protein [Bradyrhizobium sp.]
MEQRVPDIPREPITARDSFDRLTFAGWRRGLAAILLGLAVSFLLFGYALVYWRNADMDFMVIYNALLLNDGKPQQFFDHPAYITIVSLKLWFKLLHGLGLLDAWTLSAMPPASEPAAFDAAMTSAVRAGRVLGWLTASGCVLVFAGLMRLVVRDWRIALIATFAFAFSGGVVIHARILRSELLAAFPVIAAFLILIVIGRRASAARPLAMALAAFLCVLGIENKVQAVLLVAALPLIILPFGGAGSASVTFWRNPASACSAAVVAAFAAAVSAWAASPLIGAGFDRVLFEAAHFHPLLAGRPGVYQMALLMMIAACMIAYAAIWRVTVAETIASMFALAAGALIALQLLNLEFSASNVIAIFNPLEKMLSFTDPGTAGLANGLSIGGILAPLLQGIASVLARYTFVLHSSPRPTVFLTWLIVPGIVIAWRRGERQTAVQALALLLTALGIDALGVRRGLKSEYFVFTDPLIIVAGAILLDRMRSFRLHRWAWPVAATLFGLHLVVGQAEPVKYALKRAGPEPVCEWNRYHLPLLPLPWCRNLS